MGRPWPADGMGWFVRALDCRERGGVDWTSQDALPARRAPETRRAPLSRTCCGRHGPGRASLCLSPLTDRGRRIRLPLLVVAAFSPVRPRLAGRRLSGLGPVGRPARERGRRGVQHGRQEPGQRHRPVRARRGTAPPPSRPDGAAPSCTGCTDRAGGASGGGPQSSLLR